MAEALPIMRPLARTLPLLFPIITLTGLAGVIFPAFGWLPALGLHSWSLIPWQGLFSTPGLTDMVLTTLWTGFGATGLSLLLTLTFAVSCWQTRLWQISTKTLSPLLAIPHSALAIGVLFLLAPSGLFSRLAAVPMGWQRPPDMLTVNDPLALSLIFTLVLKEVPFLTLMLMAAVSQTPAKKLLTAGRTLGYSPMQCWMKLVWPRIYPKIRLSVFIVLAFSLSVVDVSLIIGPNLPPLLPVQILHWQQDPDISLHLRAAAGSLLLLALVAGSTGAWMAGEWAVSHGLRGWMVNGYRGHSSSVTRKAGQTLWSALLFIAMLSLLIVIVWSFAWRWRFPDILPSVWSVRIWSDYFGRLLLPLTTTLTIALTSTVSGVILSILCLEYPPLKTWQARATTSLFYLPLLLPQMTFLLGIQTLLVSFHLDGWWLTVVACHLLFVFPYCYLSLAGAWQKYDDRYSQAGRMLSGSRWRTLIKIKLPILLTPLLSTFALGIAVSTALYLPTLMAGAGRFETLTTEAVALASGGNRRLLALYALVQMLLPMAFFALALMLPNWLTRRRKQASLTAPVALSTSNSISNSTTSTHQTRSPGYEP